MCPPEILLREAIWVFKWLEQGILGGGKIHSMGNIRLR